MRGVDGLMHLMVLSVFSLRLSVIKIGSSVRLRRGVWPRAGRRRAQRGVSGRLAAVAPVEGLLERLRSSSQVPRRGTASRATRLRHWSNYPLDEEIEPDMAGPPNIPTAKEAMMTRRRAEGSRPGREGRGIRRHQRLGASEHDPRCFLCFSLIRRRHRRRSSSLL